ncbi:MAG: phosphoserine phosphatase SerB [Sorangiineae bacterium]|nr:phosphoserine phosphatase SerB [Polyangiaceae bacterium]MEB2322473.1 phosphoserine phosphatase SerB [Sorangiineae bacterium]
MSPTDYPERIVLHIAGADRPGVTARLAETIASERARLINIGQSTLHGYLVLSAIVDIPSGSNALRRILFDVAEQGLRLEVSAFHPAGSARRRDVPAICVTVLGQLGDGTAIARITQFLASHSMNLLEIRSLSEDNLSGLELIAGVAADQPFDDAAVTALRGEVLTLGGELGVDLAVQKDDIFRRNKRLVCMDVDSTFVKGELIDELAALVGVKDEVASITARAMRGELEFKEALTERVKLLAGLPLSRAQELSSRFELTPGADRLVKTLKSLGYRVGLVSGGFDFFVEVLKSRFGLDFAFSNELEVKDGIVTGRVQGSIVDGERKNQILKDMAKVYGVRLEQTVAIGDGANDMKMLQTAGLGIAFHAKPKLQEVADMSLNHHERLDLLLFLMGYNTRDLRSVE